MTVHVVPTRRLLLPFDRRVAARSQESGFATGTSNGDGSGEAKHMERRGSHRKRVATASSTVGISCLLLLGGPVAPAPAPTRTGRARAPRRAAGAPAAMNSAHENSVRCGSSASSCGTGSAGATTTGSGSGACQPSSTNSASASAATCCACSNTDSTEPAPPRHQVVAVGGEAVLGQLALDGQRRTGASAPRA